MNPHKNFVKKALVALVILVLIGVAGYFAFSFFKDAGPASSVSATSTAPVASTSDYPAWMQNVIAGVEKDPTSDPHISLTQYEYKGQIVYYMPVTHCCDFESSLYDEKGSFICAPDGGFSGRGDLKCTDFFTVRKNPKVIWTESR